MTDKKIIESLKAGSQQDHKLAFAYMYKVFFPYVSKYVFSNNGNKLDAEDVFQDGIIVFYEKIVGNEFEYRSTLKTYLFSICRFIWMKKLKKSSTKNEKYSLDFDLSDNALIAFEKLIEDEETKALAKLIEQGGDDCKKLLLLYYYEKRKMSEIAVHMNYSSADVVKNKKTRCMKKIRALAKGKLNYR